MSHHAGHGVEETVLVLIGAPEGKFAVESRAIACLHAGASPCDHAGEIPAGAFRPCGICEMPGLHPPDCQWVAGKGVVEIDLQLVIPDLDHPERTDITGRAPGDACHHAFRIVTTLSRFEVESVVVTVEPVQGNLSHRRCPEGFDKFTCRECLTGLFTGLQLSQALLHHAREEITPEIDPGDEQPVDMACLLTAPDQ